MACALALSLHSKDALCCHELPTGPEHASLSYFDQEQLQSFIQTHSWVDAFFADAGMPRYPYFGAKAVQVAVLRDPITR
jgi:hypothetical protein